MAFFSLQQLSDYYKKLRMDLIILRNSTSHPPFSSLSGVTLTNPQNGDILSYQGGSIINVASSSSGYLPLSGGTLTGPLLNPSYNTSNYNFRIGSFVFQPYSLNNEFIGENTYFNGTGWTRISPGYASSIQFYNGQVIFYGGDTGTGTYIPVTSLKTDQSGAGTVAIGGTISVSPGDYSGARMVVVGNGNVISNTNLVFGTDNTYDIGASGANRPRALYLAGGVTSLYDKFGTSSPEGVVTAPIGAIYRRLDGSINTSFYIKESGAGNTGWVQAGSRVTQSAITYAATTQLDFDHADMVRVLTPTGNIDLLSISNKGAGKEKILIIDNSAGGSARNITYSTFAGTPMGDALPTSIAAGKKGIFSFYCAGTTSADVLTSYTVQP